MIYVALDNLKIPIGIVVILKEKSICFCFVSNLKCPYKHITRYILSLLTIADFKILGILVIGQKSVEW